MNDFIAVDWGASSFRACHVDGSGTPISTFTSDAGVATLSVARQKVYLRQQCLRLSSTPLPLMVCGMAGSTLGIEDAGYLNCPVLLDSIPGELRAMKEFNGWMAPGLRGLSALGETEFLRGEETQLLGWLVTSSGGGPPCVVCLPGTHSKWVRVSGPTVEDFSTGLAGELFALLSRHSTLVSGEQTECERAFLAGIERSAHGEPLGQILFSCRSRVLVGGLPSCNAASYLSGLLIGSETGSQLTYLSESGSATVLIGNERLTRLYQTALSYHGIDSQCYPGDAMSIAGLTYCFQSLCSQ